MPTHLRLRSAFQFRDANPKNAFVVNPCFRRQLDITDPTSGTDAEQLCTDLADAWDLWYGTAPGQLTVKAYDVQGAKPNYPLATVTRRSGVFYPAAACPGQQALCLSFYSGQNVPRYRGRLYIPALLLKSVIGSVGSVVADTSVRLKVGELVPLFANLGGTNVDWIVWSSTSNAAHKVTNYFVDEGWDVIRSRQFPAAQRTIGTTSG